MKKSLCILFIFISLFTACTKQSETNQTTTSDKQQSAVKSNIAVFSAANQNESALETDITQNPLTTLKETNPKTTTEKATSAKEEAQEGAPMIIFLSLDELKEIKHAFDTMEADEFQTYMEKEHINTCMNGMWDYESSTALLNEMCSTYVPLLDGNPDKLDNISFYWERNDIYQLLIFDEEQRASVLIDTVNNTEPKGLQFGNEVVCISEKTIEKDNYTAHLYEYENADYRFFADILIDDTYIVLRSGWIDTMEAFEACFNRLSFVKIGDLLNE